MFSVFFLCFSFLFAVAWFTFDLQLSEPGSGLIFSNDNSTVSVEGWEHCVALGSVGFSRGVHYWEFTIDKYTADTDPAFGVARIDIARNKMLGKFDDKISTKNSSFFFNFEEEIIIWCLYIGTCAKKISDLSAFVFLF